MLMFMCEKCDRMRYGRINHVVDVSYVRTCYMFYSASSLLEKVCHVMFCHAMSSCFVVM